MSRDQERHVFDDELVLYFYGEHDEPEEIRHALDASPALRQRLAELEQIFALVTASDVPEPGADAGQRLWQRFEERLEPRLESRIDKGGERFWEILARWLAPPRPMMAAAAAVALLAALAIGFFAGRQWPTDQWPADPVALSSGEREHMLVTAVADHLERSERLLTELANAPRRGRLDAERASAAELVMANRLYRLSSQSAGRADLAWLLDDLERLLLDLAHAPERSDPASEDVSRERLEDLVFKLRVVSQNLRRPPSSFPTENPPANGGTTL